MSESLLRLARESGVGTESWAVAGSEQRVEGATLVAVLGALGIDATSPERIEVALRHLEDEPWREPLPPTVIVRQGTDVQFPVHVWDGESVEVWLELDPEAGGGRRELEQRDVYVPPRQVDGRMIGRATFAVPTDLPLGWHELRSRSADGEHQATLVVVPQRLEIPASLQRDR